MDPVTGRARLTSFLDLLLNRVNLAAFPHTLSGAAMIGGALLLAIGGYRRWQSAGGDATGQWRLLVRVGAWTTLVSGTAVALTGDLLGKVMTSVQPMKMAAAEALYSSSSGASFSIFATGKPLPQFSIEIPYLLSVLAKGSPTATVQGIDDLQAQYAAQYGPGSYVPMIPVAFWTFRLMIGIGVVAALVAAYYLWSTRRDRPGHRLLIRFLPLIPILPAAANTFGWIFTETARQPWLAFGISRVADGISPGLTRGEVIASLIGFTVVYGILAVVWLRLVRHLSRQPLAPAEAEAGDEPATDPVPVY
jgi:cytochrome d ubiquinol oxidase subunit I